MRLRLRRRRPAATPLSEEEVAEITRARQTASRIVHAGPQSVLRLFAETGTIADLDLARQEVDLALMFVGDESEIDDVLWLSGWLDTLATRLRSV